MTKNKNIMDYFKIGVKLLTIGIAGYLLRRGLLIAFADVTSGPMMTLIFLFVFLIISGYLAFKFWKWD